MARIPLHIDDKNKALQHTTTSSFLPLPLIYTFRQCKKASLRKPLDNITLLVYWSKVVTSKYMRACLQAGQTPPACDGVLASAKRLPFGSLLDNITLLVYWSKVVTSKYLRACLHAGQTPSACAGVLDMLLPMSLIYIPRLRKEAPFRKPFRKHDTFWFIGRRWLLQNTCGRTYKMDKHNPLAMASSPAQKGSLSEASW